MHVMNRAAILKWLRDVDWAFRETGRSLGQFTILVLALVLLVLPGAIMLALSALIGFCFAKMFGGGFTTMGLTFIVFAGLIARYIGPVIQPRVKLAVMALVAEPPRAGPPRK